MGFSVNTNLDALNTYRNLQSTQNSLSNSLAKLSSGLRINNAGDDAAGLTIATSLGSQVSGLQQASRNAQDGTSVVQTADGALSQAQSLLGRLRDLAVQAANDSNSTSARTAIGTEATSIKSELTRLGQSTNFNGKTLLDGTAGSMSFQVGADGNSQSQIGVSFSGAGFNLTAVATALGSTSTATYAVTPASLTASAYSFKTGSTTVGVTLSTAPTTAAGLADALNANSDFANAFSATTDSSNNLIVASKLGTAIDSSAAPGAGVAAGTTTAATVQFDTAAHAQAAITAIDTQLGNVTSARATIGALENRFASAVSNISTSITNLTAAKSRITDVDMASEMVNYSRANILAQSGTAMLAQANQAPQLALKLLG
jgi:flagellin